MSSKGYLYENESGQGIIPSSGQILATIASSTTASTFTFNGGGGTSGSATLRYQKVGDWVTLFIPAVTATSGTGSTQFVSNTAIDAAYRPLTASARAISGVITDNGGGQVDPGNFLISTAGIITMFRDGAGSAFTNSSTCGIADLIVLTYYVGTGS